MDGQTSGQPSGTPGDDADRDDVRDLGGRGTPEHPLVVTVEARSFRRAVLVVLVMLVLLDLTLWLYGATGSFLFLLLLSWLLSIAMEPAVAWFSNRGLRRGAATAVVMVILLVGVAAFLGLFGSLFFAQLAELIKGLPGYVDQAVTWVNATFRLNLNSATILDQLQITPSKVAEWAGSVAGGVVGIIGTLLGFVFDLLTVFVFAYYFSADGPRLRRAVGSWLPVRSQKVFVTVWDIAVTKTGGFVVSKVVLASLSAFFHCLFFAVIHVPYWLPLGIFAGIVSQFIPTIGTYLGILVPALFAAFNNPISVVWIVLFATVYQQLENYVFTPRISRATMDVHPAVALGAVFVGFAVFGPIGAIIGIPLAAAVIAVIETYVQRHDLVPELRARTKGEKPAKPGDVFSGDASYVVPAGTPLTEVATERAEESAGPAAPSSDASTPGHD